MDRIGRTGFTMIKEVDGVKIHYVMAGSGTEKVLLLHGWGCDGSFMQAVANALRDEFQVLIPDFPGHGQSDRPPVPWGVPDYAQCLMNFLKTLDFYPCHVIAHSFGCRVAAWIAAESPVFFKNIVFTGAAGIRPKLSEEALKRNAKYNKIKACCLRIQRIPGLRNAGEKLQTKLRQKYGSRDYNALDDEMKKTFVRVINQDLSDLYGRFQSSTLLVWGDQDTETPLWMAQEMEKRIPDAGLVVFEGGSHFVYLEQIARFNAVILHFLKGGAA